MKKILNICVLCLAGYASSIAQNEVDALRYSQVFSTGTARSMSMGGSFGALGGDFSCLSTNPAGLAVYRNSELSLTPSVTYNKNFTTYRGNEMVDSRTNFNIGNFGLVFASTSDKEGWTSVNFGLGYNKLSNYFERQVVEAYNDESSILDYYLASAEGKDYSGMRAYYEGLAYATWLIDDVGPYSNEHASALQADSAYSPGSPYPYSNFIDPTYAATQNKSTNSTGGMGEFLVSLAGSYNNKLYIGGTIGIQRINYSENYTYSEHDYNDSIYNFTSMSFEHEVKTGGTGYNIKLGALYRPVDWMRVGLAVHSPTFYKMTRIFNSSMVAVYADSTISYTAEDLNDYDAGKSEYDLVTPFKAIASLGFIVSKTALINLEYEFVDYSQIQMVSRSADDLNAANQSIRNNYKATSNVKLGLEYRNGPFSLRGGVAYYGSPYAIGTSNADAYRLAYSGGFGIKENNVYFDISYMGIMTDEKYYIYSPDVVPNDAVPLQAADMSKISSNIIATFGVKF